MLIFSQGMIKVTKSGEVKLYGVLQPYTRDVSNFITECGILSVTIKYRDGRFHFSRNVPPSIKQRIRNFLLNLPALKNLT